MKILTAHVAIVRFLRTDILVRGAARVFEKLTPACRPRKDSKLNTITFSYKLLSANALPDVNGTANTAAANSAMNLLPYVTPGSTL